ncbi:crotonase/enoyl-CoA hydratase family protein [Planktomarina sp.]|uniref:crotonase/enoyl-CoA hydratase family protein n=1 Tax=Planktomarina sp. TaxID=2024851 RepID=UPI00288F0CAB|nr:crotonase/enoyl-CoA hydratase family protein [Planktomarina sp.]MDT2070233.1 crotonase/enoyl-CoA hydratase family protein [Planktomarina sp.]
MQFDTIDSATDAQGVCTVWLNRPEKHNALSEQMIDELTEMAAILRQGSARVVILAARGKSFCAGGDLQWMQVQMQADRATRQAGARRLAGMLQVWNTLPQPVIGRIHGNAFGGGVGLASICDLAIGVETASMGLTETKLGLIPATIGPYVIARMGEATARRVFMSARKFSAHEAQSLGLLAKTVAEDALDQAVMAEVTPYLSCAPGAVAAAKKLARALGPVIDAQTIEMTVTALIQQWESPEAEEGIAAFFGKTAPSWQVR